MSVTRDDWLKALNDAMPDDDPLAMTTAELCQQFGYSETSARRRLRKLVAEKRAERVTKVVADSQGRRVRVSAYRLVE